MIAAVSLGERVGPRTRDVGRSKRSLEDSTGPCPAICGTGFEAAEARA